MTLLLSSHVLGNPIFLARKLAALSDLYSPPFNRFLASIGSATLKRFSRAFDAASGNKRLLREIEKPNGVEGAASRTARYANSPRISDSRVVLEFAFLHFAVPPAAGANHRFASTLIRSRVNDYDTYRRQVESERQ